MDWFKIRKGAFKALLSYPVYLISMDSIYMLALSISHVRIFVTPWTLLHQIPLSMAFSRQEYWSELPFTSPGDLPDQGMEPGSSALQADSLLIDTSLRVIICSYKNLFKIFSYIKTLFMNYYLK